MFPEEEDKNSAPVSFRRVAGVGLGLVAFAACIAVVLVSSYTGKKTHRGLTTRELLEHADVHQVATDNLLKIHSDWFGQKLSPWVTRNLAEQIFRNMSRQLAKQDPKLANQEISPEQKDALVHAMRYLSDNRVQKFGYDVAKAVKTIAKKNPASLNDPAKLKKSIARTLGKTKLAEIRSLRDEMFPDELAKEYGKGGGFEHLLDPKRVQFMSKIDDKWEDQFKMMMANEETSPQERRMQGYTGGWGGAPAGAAPAYGAPAGFGVQTTTDHNLGTTEAVLGTMGAIAEEANALVRMIRPMGKEFKNDLNVSPMATSGIGAAAFMLETADCEINAAMDKFNPIEMAGCPLEFGSEGFDACREFLAMAGILGDNDCSNGHTGNHNGDEDGTSDDDAGHNDCAESIAGA
jgi:hypothetical protein